MRKSIPMPLGTEKPRRLKPPRTHRNEFPTGYSLAGRSPALPASASPVQLILRLGSPLFNCLKKGRSPIQSRSSGPLDLQAVDEEPLKPQIQQCARFFLLCGEI